MKKNKLYRLTSDTGEIFITDKLYRFCKEHELNTSAMINILKGRNGRKKHKGWRIENIDPINDGEVIFEDGSEPDLYTGAIIHNTNYKSNLKSSVKGVKSVKDNDNILELNKKVKKYEQSKSNKRISWITYWFNSIFGSRNK